MLRAASTLALVAMCGVLAGCGTDRASTDVFAVHVGMTNEQVRRVAGTPRQVARDCWVYDAHKQGTGIYQRRFCFTDGRVSKATADLHLPFLGPQKTHHTTWWPYAAGTLALLGATTLGLRRARPSATT
jgi:hypothetical protein